MKCVICDQKATKKFSPDMDIQGIGACDEHLEDVRLGYAMLLQGDEEMYKGYISGLRKKFKKKNKVSL